MNWEEKEKRKRKPCDDIAAEVKVSRQLTEAGFPQNKSQAVCTSIWAFLF